MRFISSTAFPLVVLTLLAALTFWLNVTSNGEDRQMPMQRPRTADAVVETMVATTYGENGNLRMRLIAPRLTHFDEDDSSLIEAPRFTQFRIDAKPLTLIGDHAKVSAKGETVYLWGNVIATRPGTNEQPDLTARMPDLTLQPDAGTGFTHSPVEIIQGKSWIRATGLEIDNNTSTLVLTSAVTGEYQPRTEQP